MASQEPLVIQTLYSSERVFERNPKTVCGKHQTTVVNGSSQGLKGTHWGCCWAGWAVTPARIDGVDTDFWSVSRGASSLGFSIGPELRFSCKITYTYTF